MGFFKQLLGLLEDPCHEQARKMQRFLSETQLTHSMVNHGWRPYANNWTQKEKYQAIDAYMVDGKEVTWYPPDYIDESRCLDEPHPQEEKLQVAPDLPEEKPFWKDFLGL